MEAPGGASVDHGREPCPDRIIDDVGGAFGMGAVGGSIWHFVKGLRNSPSGGRIAGGLQSIRREAPRTGGSFAVWGCLFSTFDCTLVAIRKKEDPWNSIGAGFLTGGFLQLRTGPRSAAQSAVFGGVLLAMIEGLGIVLTKMTAPAPAPPPALEGMMPAPQQSTGSIPLPSAPIAAPDGATAFGNLQRPENMPAPAVSSTADTSSSGVGSWLSSIFSGGANRPQPQAVEELDLSEA